jgi:hypothetical protein
MARRALAWALAATLLVPAVLALVLGLGALMGALGDTTASAWCGRIALVVGVVWLTALVGTTVAAGMVVLMDEPPHPHVRRRRHRRRRRRPVRPDFPLAEGER